MRKKQFNSHLYLTEKFVFTRSDGWVVRSLPNNYLYADGIYPTKICPEDLPGYYIEGQYYKRRGYLDAKNIKQIIYKPNMFFNHAFKDDVLLISYRDTVDVSVIEDYRVYGGQIPYFVKAVKKYAGLDMSRIEQQIRDKLAWFKETYPDFYELEVGSWVYEP